MRPFVDLSDKQLEHLITGARELGVMLTEGQGAQFSRYASLLAEWNEKINLTRVPHAEIVPLHFLDSLTVASVVNLQRGSELIDVGTGAGFPGVPLKIAFPNLSVTLMDSTRKKLDFLRVVIDDLGLKGIDVMHLRAEDAGHDAKLRGHFTHATARAVAQASVLFELMLPLVKVGGEVVLLKSAQIDDELEASRGALSLLGGRLEKVQDITIPGTEIPRTIVVASKIKETNEKYPRHSGQIKAKPLVR